MTINITDEDRIWALRRALGWVENASDRTVKIYQDDATETFFIHIGKGGVSGGSFLEAMNKLVMRMRDERDAELAADASQEEGR